MIKLRDWLIEYNPLDEMYALSHSQHVEDSGGKRGEPYRISRLNVHLFANVRDCLHNFRQGKWQIVFIGSFSSCMERRSDLQIMKKWDSEELEEWGKKTFVEFCKEDDDEPPEGESDG